MKEFKEYFSNHFFKYGQDLHLPLSVCFQCSDVHCENIRTFFQAQELVFLQN